MANTSGEETNILRRIMLRLSGPTMRLFRNNVGTAYIGQATTFRTSGIVNVDAGDVLVKQGRIFHAGLVKGSSDIIGIKSVIITPEMVGKPVAVFTAIEGKTKSGRATVEQIAFINMVNGMGGIAFIARNEEEAELLMVNALKK